jgi:hypothetical protein
MRFSVMHLSMNGDLSSLPLLSLIVIWKEQEYHELPEPWHYLIEALAVLAIIHRRSAHGCRKDLLLTV